MSQSGPVARSWELPSPPQSRGRRRRASILAAASGLVDSDGYRHVTIRAIADASGASPATIYHYFPDVDSIVAAVAWEYLGRLAAAVEHVFDHGEPSLDQFAARVVAAFRTTFAQHPGLRELWFSRRASAKIDAIHAYHRDQLAKAMRNKAAQTVADPGDELRYRAAIEALGSLWELAFALDPHGNQRVVDEITYRFRRVVGHGVLHVPREAAAVTAGSDAVVDILRASLDAEPRPWLHALPPQRRGRVRREAILRAASTLIDEHGPRSDKVTLRTIADLAGVPPASVYQYFRDVDALVAGVAVEYMNQLLRILDQTYARPSTDAASLTRGFVAAYRAHFAEHPGLRSLWFDHYASADVAAVRRYYQLTAATVALHVRARITGQRGDLLDHVMIVTQTGALWDLAFSLDPAGHDDVVDEIVALLLVRRPAAGTPP